MEAAAKAGIASSVIITRIPGIKLHITTEYTGLGKIQYILGQRGITTLDSVYTDKVELEVLTAEAEAEAVKAELTEGTNGQAIIEIGAVCHFAKINGTPQILD